MIYTLCIANECLKSPTIYIGQIGSATKTTSGIQYCPTFRVSYIVRIYSYFNFSLPADGKCKSFLAMTPGYAITSVFVIGVALLGQTSFEIDTVPMNG